MGAPTAATAGVGGHTTPTASRHPVRITFPEGQEVSLKVRVMQLPGTLAALTGCEVLGQTRAVLTTAPV